jgi:hypothetical protein
MVDAGGLLRFVYWRSKQERGPILRSRFTSLRERSYEDLGLYYRFVGLADDFFRRFGCGERPPRAPGEARLASACHSVHEYL